MNYNNPNEIDEYEPSVEDYINRIKYDDNPKVRANALFILGRLNEISALPTMIEAFEKDESHDVKMTIIEVLGKFRVPEVVAPLLKAAQAEQADLRAEAMKSLGLAGQMEALDTLVNGLGDPSPEVRVKAAEGLGALRAEGATDVLVNTLVADDDSNVRYFATQSLILIGGEQVRDSLIQRLERESHVGVLLDLIETLAKLKDPTAIEALQVFTTHDDNDLQVTARWAIDVLKKQN